MQNNCTESIKDLAKKSFIIMCIMMSLCGLLGSYGAKAAEEKTLTISFNNDGFYSSYSTITLTSATVDGEGNYIFNLSENKINAFVQNNSGEFVYWYRCNNSNIIGSGNEEVLYDIEHNHEILINGNVFEDADNYEIEFVPVAVSARLSLEMEGISEAQSFYNPGYYGFQSASPSAVKEIFTYGMVPDQADSGALVFANKWRLKDEDGLLSEVVIREKDSNYEVTSKELVVGTNYCIYFPISLIVNKDSFDAKIVFTPVYEASVNTNYTVSSGTLPDQTQTVFTAVSDENGYLRTKITLPDVIPNEHFMLMGWYPPERNDNLFIKLAGNDGEPLPERFNGYYIGAGKEIYAYISEDVAKDPSVAGGIPIEFTAMMPVVLTKYTYDPGDFGSIPEEYVGADAKYFYSEAAKITYGDSQTISPKVSVTFPDLQIDETSDKDFVGYKIRWNQNYAGKITMIDGANETEVTEETVFSGDSADLYLRTLLYEGDGEIETHLTFDAFYAAAPVLKVRYGSANQSPVNIRPTSRSGGLYTYSVYGANDSGSLENGMTRVWMIPELPSGWECSLNGHSDRAAFFFGGETLGFEAGLDSYAALAENGVLFESGEAIASSGTYEDLSADSTYLLKEGTWTIDGDGYTYNVSERTTIYFSGDGTYTFRKNN